MKKIYMRHLFDGQCDVISGEAVNEVMDRPLLSIALPTYRYLEGIKRILCTLPLGDQRIEVVVGDDTPDDSIGAWIQGAGRLFASRLKYHHNTPALGAVPNWNDLIRRSTGKYVWLLHHDECPIDETAVIRLLALLGQKAEMDVVLLDCVLALGESGVNRRHMPNWMRALVITKSPNYLLRRNLVGPASTIVIRREIYEMYDESLRWLVDVELYKRMFAKARRVYLAHDVTVLSFPGRLESITASLQPDLHQIFKQERGAIYNDGGQPNGGRNAGRRGDMGRVSIVMESMLWNILRGFLRLPSWLGISALPRKKVRDAWGRGLHEQICNK